MARESHSGTAPWIAFAAGAVAALALILAYAAMRQGSDGVQVLADTDLLPSLRQITPPSLPDAPRLPDSPMPSPR